MNDILVKVGADISNFAKGMNEAAKKANEMGKATEKGTLTIGKLVAAIGGIKLLSAGFDMVKNSISGAIDRYDTLNNFPRVLEMMGFDAEESNRAINKLSDGIDGLPTKLDSVVSTAQGIAIMTGDLDGAVDTTLALNNAFLASGSSASDAERGLEQYRQMLSKGEVDLQSWRTLQETMPVALNKTAEAFGYTGASAQNDLYDALKAGEYTFDEFNAKLIELSEETGGFADMAREASGGIKTAWTNMGTSIVRGVANIIEAIDNFLASNGLPTIQEMIERVRDSFDTALSWIADNIPNIINVIQGWKDALEPVKPLIIGITTAIGIMLAASAAFGTIRGLVNGLTASVALLGRTFGLTAAPMFAIIAVLALVGAAIYQLWQSNEEFRQNVQVIWEHLQQIFSMVMENMAVATVAFIGALMELINAMAPVIAYVAEAIASFLGWLVTMMETHSWVSTVVTVVLALSTAIAIGIPIVAGIVKVFTVLWSILKVVWTVITFVANVFRILFTVIRAVAMVVSLFLSPLGLVIAIGAAVVGVIVWLGGHFEWLGNIVEKVSGWISDAWNGFLDILGFGTKEAADEAGSSLEGLSDTADSSTSQMAKSAEINIGGMHDGMNAYFDGMNQYGIGQLEGLNIDGTAQLDALSQNGISSLDSLSTGGQASLGALSATGSSELQGLHSTGISEIAGLSSSGLTSIDDMAVGSTSSVAGMNTDISGLLSDLGDTGSIEIGNMTDSVTGDIGDMSSISIDEISDLTNSGSADFSSLETDMTGSASNIKSEVESSFSGMASSVETEMSNIENASTSSLDGLASKFKSSMTDISSTIKSSMQDVAQATQGGMQAVTSAAMKGMQQTSRAIQQGTTRMNADVARSMTQIQRIYTQGFARITALTRSNMKRIVSVTNSGMSSVNTAFSKGMNRSASISQSAGNRIVSIFRNLQGQLRNAGAMAMAGLQSGLNSRSSSVMATARNIANNVASTMRKALKVKSPSRITTEIGGFTGEGLEIGLIKSRNAVLKAAEGLAKAAVPNIDMSYATPAGLQGSLSSAVNGTVSVNSNARDRALIGAINGLRRDMSNMRVEMDGEPVGRITRPYINEGNAKDEVGRYFG